MKRLRTLDLFCGGGGSSWGACAAGAEIVAGVDADPIAIEAFQRNFPRAAVFADRLSEETRPEDYHRIGPIDLLLASPECTNHTWARGSRAREEESRRSARYVLGFARHFRPRWLVIENVVSMRRWDGYEEFLGEIRALGYAVSPELLDAVHFGVPQTRRRLFLLGSLDGMPMPMHLAAIAPRPARLILDPEGTHASGPLWSARRARPTLERAGRAIARLGRGVPFLVVYYGSDGSGGWQPLDRPLRTLTTLDRFGLVTWRDGEPWLRMLQVPELERAMGLDMVATPEPYRLDHGSRRDRIRLLGNGVCPPVMKAVVEHLVGVAGNSLAA